ncbi:hypothetical protein ADEAN_000781400 [Angomonas deanei]|uniref:E3 ubiquitin-protein ligase n=1 Tax=Angomonas deanei TaxID=59799 RepID=A0A7G2CLK4_9TRYP|nr:hypothetical protein ADEAN_000781400 [Angomonas deanei]
MVLSDSSLNQVLTVGESGDVVQCTPLEPSVLSNRTSLIGSVRVLMGYLLEEEYSRPLDQPAGQLPLSFTYQRLEELSLMYTGAEAWGCTVAEHILCFPSEYLVFLYEHYRQLSACAECSALDSEKAICCYCRRAVCVDSLGAELMSHCRSCVGLGVSDTCDGQMNKLGLFLQGQRSLIISVDPQTAYFCYYPSFYLDKYGETNESLKVKNSLFRSTARVIKFLNVWLCGSWSMNPKLVKRTFSKPVSFLSA